MWFAPKPTMMEYIANVNQALRSSTEPISAMGRLRRGFRTSSATVGAGLEAKEREHDEHECLAETAGSVGGVARV